MKFYEKFDLISRLANQNVFLASQKARVGEYGIIWKVAILDFITTDIESGVTRFFGVNTLADAFSIPKTVYSSVRIFLKGLVDAGLIDTTGKQGDTAYKTNINWKPGKPLLITADVVLTPDSRKELYPGKSFRVVMSPRMHIVTVRNALAPYRDNLPDLCYPNDIADAVYTLVGRDGTNKLRYAQATGVINPILKAFWFSLLRVKFVPDFNDLDGDQFWDKFSYMNCASNKCLASLNDSKIPNWDAIDPIFWKKYVSAPRRAALIKAVSTWATPLPAKVVSAAYKSTDAINTVADNSELTKVLSKVEPAKDKEEVKPSVPPYKVVEIASETKAKAPERKTVDNSLVADLKEILSHHWGAPGVLVALVEARLKLDNAASEAVLKKEENLYIMQQLLTLSDDAFLQVLNAVLKDK